MSPIRIGLLGLNASFSWAVWAHLPYLMQSSKYEIVALCNSSVASAEAAIKAHNLPSTTKAYGSPADLAADADVDLVVCSVRVDRHYETILPSLKAGKDVYCEWPLGKNLAEAEELTRVARQKGIRTMVGLQAVKGMAVRTARKEIEAGRVGKVLSVSFWGSANNGGNEEKDRYAYLNDREVGGNVATIHFMHTLSAIFHTVNHEISSFSSILTTQFPLISITDKALTDPTRNVIYTVPRTSFDQILLQGHLSPSKLPTEAATTEGPLINFHLRGGREFDDKNTGFQLRIYGTEGELFITAPATSVQLISAKTMRVQFSKLDGSAPVDIAIDEDVWDEKLKDVAAAQNVARLYEAFAEGKRDSGDEGYYPDWEEAVKRHKLIDEMYKRHDAGEQDKVLEYSKI